MTTVSKLWPGETAVLLGCGPSLTREDVESVRGKARVIAINTSHELAPWADVLYSSDLGWWRQVNGAPGFTGLKYAVHSGTGRLWKLWPDVQVLANTGTDGLELKPHGLRTIRNSGGAAINLAMHFGARRILLLGYDMGRRGRQAHWFGDHPNPLRNASPYAEFMASFATMVKPLRTQGVTVLNCSRETALRCFQRATLADALSTAVAA